MTTTRVKTRKTESLFHDGRRGRYTHSLATTFWMEVKVSSSLGTKNTERSMKKRCCIILIQARKDRSLSTSRNQGNRKVFNHGHRQRAREPSRGHIIPRMKKEEEKVLEAATLPMPNDMASLPVPPTVLIKPVIIPRTLNREKSVILAEVIIEETTSYSVILVVLDKAYSLIIAVLNSEEKAAYPVIPEMLTKEEMAPLQTHPGLLIKHLFTKVRKMCIIYNCCFKRKLDCDLY